MKANGQVFVSGQIPADKSGNLIEGSVADKTELCCQNVIAVLNAAGSSIGKVVKVNVSNKLPSPHYLCYSVCSLIGYS